MLPLSAIGGTASSGTLTLPVLAKCMSIHSMGAHGFNALAGVFLVRSTKDVHVSLVFLNLYKQKISRDHY